ncbi:SMF3 Iron transporter SMF3 [Candida maltosa Xu316]
MPHSLYLGSSLVQARLKDYDEKNNRNAIIASADTEVDEIPRPPVSKLRRISDGSMLASKYKPSYAAIKYCLNYSYVELILSLFIVAVFVNSAILIVAGSTLYGQPDAADADLLSIYEMLSYYISPAAGLIFALSMLFSGQSAGIVCTMAGQIVSEGFINWTIEPWKRRIITRVLAILPVLVVVGILGREGVSKVMNSSQVVLSFILPIVSAPLIYFTSKKEYMMVVDKFSTDDETGPSSSSSPVTKKVSFENGTFLRCASITTWVIISALNFYLIIAFANGADI